MGCVGSKHCFDGGPDSSHLWPSLLRSDLRHLRKETLEVRDSLTNTAVWECALTQEVKKEGKLLSHLLCEACFRTVQYQCNVFLHWYHRYFVHDFKFRIFRT